MNRADIIGAESFERGQRVEFWKMNGAGNDFIVLNNLVEKLPEAAFPALARRLCERHLSIGADGLIVVDAVQDRGDYRMRFYNSDGSLGEMCGNGARCVCRYGFETGLAGEKQTVETTAGIVTGVRISERLYRVRLNDPSVVKLNCPVEVDGTAWPCSYVELGNPGIPHAVIPYPGLRQADETQLRELGRRLRHHPAFPKGANVNFYELTGEDTLWERTFERGVEDFTLACGTGCGSTAAVLNRKGLLPGGILTAHNRGGVLKVTVTGDPEAPELYLEGPTEITEIFEIPETEL